MWPFSKSTKCDCAAYPHLTLDRKAITKRIQQSTALKMRIEVVAEDPKQGIALFRCPTCGETLQSGRERNFGNEVYLSAYRRMVRVVATENVVVADGQLRLVRRVPERIKE